MYTMKDKDLEKVIAELEAILEKETVAERRIMYRVMLADVIDSDNRSMEGVQKLGINETVSSALIVLAIQAYHNTNTDTLIGTKEYLDELRQLFSSEQRDPMDKLLKDFKGRNYEA